MRTLHVQQFSDLFCYGTLLQILENGQKMANGQLLFQALVHACIYKNTYVHLAMHYVHLGENLNIL